jgi:hypothetical protein
MLLQKITNLLRPTPNIFRFDGYETDDCSGQVRFHYSCDNGLNFCELLEFDHPLPPYNSARRPQFEAALEVLSVAYGIRYYQGYTPPQIAFNSFLPTSEQRAFFQDFYKDGLGEFGYRNNIDVSAKVNFFDAQPSLASSCKSTQLSKHQMAETASETLPRLSAVLVGGGKDSLVSIEVLRAAEEPMLLFAVNPTRPIRACAHASGFPFVAVRHRGLGGTRGKKGSVPHAAINSLTAIAAAFVYGFDTVVLSNERSAEEGNVLHDGRMINHQYGKTAQFERGLQTYLAIHIPGVTYFSLLRPLSELHIARLLSDSSRYDGAFMSCNQGRKSGVWCRRCAKCQFSYLALATAMPPERMQLIFGANMLDEEKQLQGYEELTGLSGHKPWECVGEIAESAVALLSLSEQPAWKDNLIVKLLTPRLQPLIANPKAVWDQFLTPSPVQYMPKRFEEMLHTYIRGSGAQSR